MQYMEQNYKNISIFDTYSNLSTVEQHLLPLLASRSALLRRLLQIDGMNFQGEIRI